LLICIPFLEKRIIGGKLSVELKSIQLRDIKTNIIIFNTVEFPVYEKKISGEGDGENPAESFTKFPVFFY
jgi:hypothetical protein